MSYCNDLEKSWSGGINRVLDRGKNGSGGAHDVVGTPECTRPKSLLSTLSDHDHHYTW